MANERINEIKQGYIDEIEREEKVISELKSIGKNYKLKKNGEPFADLRKTLNGVEGIVKVVKQNLRTKFKFWLIVLPSNDYIYIDIEHPSIADVEEKIKEAIATSEKALAVTKKTLEALDGMAAECDNMVHQIAAMVPEDTEIEGINSLKYNLSLTYVMESYIVREIEDMFEKKRESYQQTEREKRCTA